MNVCGATDIHILDLGLRPPWLDPEVVHIVIQAFWCYTCPTTILPINLSLSNCFITREANASLQRRTLYLTGKSLILTRKPLDSQLLLN